MIFGHIGIICSKHKLYFEFFINQKVKQVYTANNISNNKNIEKKIKLIKCFK